MVSYALLNINKINLQVVALIFIPGAGLAPDSYIALARDMQTQLRSEKKSLWVGIPHCPLDTAAVGIKRSVDRIADALSSAGLPDKHFTLYGGHSLVNYICLPTLCLLNISS